MNNATIALAWVYATIFLGLTILGLASNSLAEEKAFFETNLTFNLVHLTTAIWFVFSTKISEEIRIQFMQMFGMTFMLVSVMGFLGTNLQIEYQLSDVIYLNLQSYLQFGLGIIISASGSILIKKQQRISVV